jgi:hypothetical protein
MTVNSRKFKKNCVYCDKEYFAAKPFSKFCTDRCRVYYSQDKKAYEENVREELPMLLTRVNSEFKKLNNEPSVDQESLDKAIQIILKAQSKLNSLSVQIKSFDEYLIQKNKNKTKPKSNEPYNGLVE